MNELLKYVISFKLQNEGLVKSKHFVSKKTFQIMLSSL